MEIAVELDNEIDQICKLGSQVLKMKNFAKIGVDYKVVKVL